MTRLDAAGVGRIAMDFGWAAVGGVAIGFAVAVVLIAVRKRLTDTVSDTTLSLVAPWVAFLPAEQVHASGVLAVVVTGLLLGHKAPVVQSAASRISERTYWRTIQHLLENAVFLLIGLQAYRIVTDVADSELDLPDGAHRVRRRAARGGAGAPAVDLPVDVPDPPAAPAPRPASRCRGRSRPSSPGPACAAW